jgi:hypothetical protein
MKQDASAPARIATSRTAVAISTAEAQRITQATLAGVRQAHEEARRRAHGGLRLRIGALHMNVAAGTSDDALGAAVARAVAAARGRKST